MPNTKYIGGVLQGPSGPLPPDLEVRLVGRVRAGVGRACLPWSNVDSAAWISHSAL